MNLWIFSADYFYENILASFRHVLNSTYFIFGGQFYEQMDGVAIGSPLSPVIADFFMEDFESKALQSATHRPTCWFQYVDDTFVVWPHGQEKLTDFLTHLYSLNSKIQFTMETEIDGYLPFLDIHIYSRSNGSLGHKVYQKPTHTYISMPVHFVICPINRLSWRLWSTELTLCLIVTASKMNWISYAPHFRTTAMTTNKYGRPLCPVRPTPRLIINQFQQHYCHIVAAHTTNSIECWWGTTSRVWHFRWRKVPLFYSRLGQSGTENSWHLQHLLWMWSCLHWPNRRTTEVRLKEHERNIWLLQTDKSAVAGHSFNNSHKILFKDTAILLTKPGYLEHLTTEAIVVDLQPSTINREVGLTLSRSWIPILQHLKEEKK